MNSRDISDLTATTMSPPHPTPMPRRRHAGRQRRVDERVSAATLPDQVCLNMLRAILMALVAVGLISEAKAAAPFVLTPPPQNAALGASQMTQQALRPVGPIGPETQYAEFRLSASELLKNSQEHIAVSLMATDQPFTAGGAWTITAPGGGIGIALGTISSQFHPACPADLNNSRVEFAIERFGANDPNASTLIKCVSFAKSVLISAPTFKITVSTDCVASSCFTMATLRNAATNAVIASVSAPSVTRANTTRLRKVWYAVTDFDKVDAKRYSATFEVLTEEYYAEPQGGPLP